MDISTLQGINLDEIWKTTSNSLLQQNAETGKADFQSIFQTAMDMIRETDQLQKNAESETIRFALGEAENTHDLQIAQYKANYALMYTNAVRNKALEAYKEIMNIQI